MYCPKCGAQSDQQTKYCKACGQKLADVAQLLDEPRDAEQRRKEERREKRMRTGVTLLIVTFFDLLLFLSIFAATTLPHLYSLENPWPFRANLITLVILLKASLITGGIGIFQLWRSGFFRNWREREQRSNATLSGQPRPAISAGDEGLKADFNWQPRVAEAMGVTEHTTRDLERAPLTTRKIKGE